MPWHSETHLPSAPQVWLWSSIHSFTDSSSSHDFGALLPLPALFLSLRLQRGDCSCWSSSPLKLIDVEKEIQHSYWYSGYSDRLQVDGHHLHDPNPVIFSCVDLLVRDSGSRRREKYLFANRKDGKTSERKKRRGGGRIWRLGKIRSWHSMTVLSRPANPPLEVQIVFWFSDLNKSLFCSSSSLEEKSFRSPPRHIRWSRDVIWWRIFGASLSWLHLLELWSTSTYSIRQTSDRIRGGWGKEREASRISKTGAGREKRRNESIPLLILAWFCSLFYPSDFLLSSFSFSSYGFHFLFGRIRRTLH